MPTFSSPKAAFVALLAMVMLAGCASRFPPVTRGDHPDFRTVVAPQPLPPEANHGAIFQAANATTLFEDFKARRVGDILTVVLSERTNARKSANTNTAKDSSVSLTDPILGGRPITSGGTPILNTEVEMQRSFDGSGDAAQSNQLEGSITVTVAEVLPNGNLVIQGEKWVQINQGKEYIRLRGIVRTVDIRPDNSVLSTQVGDAQVAYGGTGAGAQANSPGWLTRFFNSPIWPF
jgi:flagellar L-ring protein precursor FlgH